MSDARVTVNEAIAELDASLERLRDAAWRESDQLLREIGALQEENGHLRASHARLRDALREIEFLQPGLDRDGNLIEGHAAMVAACKSIARAAIAAAEGGGGCHGQ